VPEPELRLFAPEGGASGERLPDTAPLLTPVVDDATRWKEAIEAVKATSPRHGKSLSFGRIISMTGSEIRLGYPADAGFHRAAIFGNSRPTLEQTLSTHFGRPIKLVEESSSSLITQAPKSVAEIEAGDRLVREKDIEAKVKEHPAVRSVLRLLGGSLEHIQVLEPASALPLDSSSVVPEEET
jgi:hypothetical protein